ncbi:MAG TPA: TonB-dependent receptor [Pyrinomonadaceae bacterium]|nr:TonB-dependent receptor [Pyrinomonadaceae bacterium]
MDVEVTSVSRRPEKLSQTASSIQVITGEEIRRSGATTLPEALRLASNLHVAQVDASQWAISARGFNNTTANKMLVLIDGRTVYTPLYAGVFWDIQDVLLEDVDRIEVISGSGATLWGANAVNGVISVKTKHARDTKGLLVEMGAGNQPRSFMNVRYGGEISSDAHYRVYGKIFARERTVFSNGRDAGNDWYLGQGGFRMDWHKSPSDSFTLQGDIYDGRIDQLATLNTDVKGGNILGRWSRVLSGKSDLSLQFYFDRTHRGIPRIFAEDLSTYDVDFQHRLHLGERNEFVWGLGYRQIDDDIRNGSMLAFLPAEVTHRRINGFLQDEITFLKDRLHLTFGTKVEHNDYSGAEVQPSVRAIWKMDRRQVLWGAISRAVRTPSRIDRELFIPAQPPFLLAGGPDFKSENALEYELGYRTHAHDRVSFSVSGFYNKYTDLRSIEQVNPPHIVPLKIGNGLDGESYGMEVTADYYVNNWWRLHSGFTEMRINIRPQPTSTDRSNGSGESHDPNRHLLLRSSFDLPRHVQFDSVFRFVSEIANQQLPGYAEMDLRLSWQPKPSLEFAIAGQNLLHDRHAEFGPPATRQEIGRSVYGKIIWSFPKH